MVVVCCSIAVHAQMQVTYNGKELNYSTANIQYALTTNAQFSNSILFKQQQKFWQPLVNNKVNLLETPYSFWLKIPVNTLLSNGAFEVLNIDNPHINFLKCWIIYKDSIVKEYPLTGDNLPFATRLLPTPSYVFHISSNLYKDCSIVLVTDKKYTRLDVPVQFYSAEYYVAYIQKQNLLMGIFLGLGLFLFVFNTYLFISLKQSLYMWYSIYLLTVITYVCTDLGLLFTYLYPHLPKINDIIRPSIFALSSFPLMFFFNNLLSIKTHFPKVYRFNKQILFCYLLLFIAGVATSSTGNFQIQGFWVKMNRVVGPIMLIIVVTESFYCLAKNIRFAIFSVLSFTCFFVFIFIYSLHQNGIIPHNGFTSTANYWGIILEALIIAFSLAWRYKLYKQDSERLLKENIEQQEKIFRETAAWQEKEMQRMSSLLHDTVGANLGFLRLETDNMQLTEEGRNKIATHITQIGNDVRNMSHSFSPIVLQDKGLYNAIDDMVKLIRNNSLINIQFEWIGEKQKTSIQYQIIIYRIIQELMQNMLKHSKAKNAFLQIMIQQKLVSIYVEDDGIGMIANVENTGVGLKSIETLVQLLKGSCRIESNEKDGFSISIEFNQYENENL